MSAVLATITGRVLNITVDCLVATYTASGEKLVGLQPRLSSLCGTPAVISFRLVHADSSDNVLADPCDTCANAKQAAGNTAYGSRLLGPVFLAKGEKLKLYALSSNRSDTCVSATVIVLDCDPAPSVQTPPVLDGPAEEVIAKGPVGQVFLCYARKDAKWRDDLLNMLSPVMRRKPLDIWHDGKIKPSEKWRREIDEALKRARIGVLLVSTHFLASDFIKNEELPFLIKAAEKAKVKLSWVLISEAMYEEEQFAKLQALHDIAKPLKALKSHNRDKVLKQIAQRILDRARCSP